jgi:hypothetical protein
MPPKPIRRPAPPPDVALEFAECFTQLLAQIGDTGLDESALEGVIRTTLQTGFEQIRESLAVNPLTAAIAELFPSPPRQVSVAFLCSKIEHEVAGVWLNPLIFITATDPTLASLQILPAGEIFAIQFSASTLQEFIDAVWAAIEKSNGRLGADGTPDPNGPIEIKQRPTLTSPTQSTLQLVVKGTYHFSQFNINVGIDFTLTSTETLFLQPIGGGLQIVSSTNSQTIDLDEAKVHEVQAAIALISFFTGFFSGPLNGWLQNQILDAIASGEAQIPTLLTLGSSLASVIPVVLIISGSPDKIYLPLDSVICDLNGGGITISGGVPQIARRQPAVFVDGPASIVVNRYIDQSQVINQTFTLKLVDFSTVKTYSWTEGATVVSTGASFDAAFQIGNLRVGQSNTYNFHVVVVDDAGLSASTNFSVTVRVTNYKPATPPKQGTGILQERTI